LKGKPQTSNTSVSPARAAAFHILHRVEQESSYAAELLHGGAYEGMSIADHGLATELVMGVLRWRSLLDNEIAQASSQPLAKLDLEVLISLRLALYQLRRLDRIPARAAIHESVELVKRSRKRSAAPFVNAVLRKLAAGTPVDRAMSVADPGSSSPESLSLAFAHPNWLVRRWATEYGMVAAQNICEYDQSVPATSIRLRNPAAEGALRDEGVEVTTGRLLQAARQVTKGDVTKTAAFRTGQVVIQDEASQLVAALVGQGSFILDCCAAPGGKTLAIADGSPAASVTAVELHPHRARLLQRLLGRSQPSPPEDFNPRIRVIAADARHLPSKTRFDRILADVPCSGTGTLAHNPEIKWRLEPRDLADLHERQYSILGSALAQLAPAGRLVYSTCSLEREENEAVIERVLAEEASIQVRDCSTELERLRAAGELTWSGTAPLTRGPFLRTLPGIQPCEGFFAAILQKT
jgi:16S rRNA (cytosine967-C5)-methyltransferase